MSDENERSVASAGSVAGGNDLIDRLSDLSGDVGRWGGKTIGEAIAEIERLREAIRRLADQDATLSVCDGAVTVQMDATPEMLEQCSQRDGPLMPFDPPNPLTLSAGEHIDVEELICELHHIAGSEQIDVDVRRVACDAEAALSRLRAWVNELQMNVAEREAVETAMNAYGSDNANPECAAIEATLWGLLERTK